ncbi:MAG TPA: hypothetical protein VEC18_03505, partial [Myxococcota bacterium]|nr:hypothetical protein [Myxococcota bacterium]
MRRARRGLLLLAAGLALAAALALLAAWWLAARVSSPDAQRELEARLSAALSTPVTIGKLNIAPWSWGRLEARDLRAWPSGEAFGLEISRALGSVDPIALTFGELRLRRVELEGALLKLEVLRASAAARPSAVGSPEAAAAAPPREPGLRESGEGAPPGEPAESAPPSEPGER